MTTQNSPPESEPATEDANRPRQQNQQNQQNTNNINTPNPGTGQVLGDRHTEDGVKDKEKPSTSDSDGHLSETESEHDLEDEQEVIAAQPQLSRQTSSFVRTDSVVPRSQRRGLLAKFAIIPEIERPYEYKNKTKWAITVLVSIQAAGAPFGTGIFYPALPEMSSDLHASPTVTNLSIALYMLAMSIFPLWWSSFSETLGRRTIYIASFALFVVFAILSAVSVNIAMLIVMRLLAGGASASVQAVGAGTIADIWEPAERGRAMGIFYLGPLIGPLISPIIGGLLSEAFGWRSTMWFLTIYGAVVLIMIIFCLPETLSRDKLKPKASSRNPSSEDTAETSDADARPTPLRRVSTTQSVKLKTKRAGALFKRFFVDPLQVLLYLRYPPVIVSVYSASICFGALFVLNISIQATFAAPPYSFSVILVGLLYLPLSLGYILASMLGGRWIDRIMVRAAQKAGRYDADGKLVFLPEDRMRENMWLAATLYPGALIWYGWTAQHHVHWVVPCIANFFFGVGSMLVFGAVTTMLTEFMPHRSSSGVAVNNFVRNIFSCAGAVVAQPWVSAMGNGWVTTIIGLFAWVTGNVAIWLLRRNAQRWRGRMDEALNKEK